WRDVEHMTAVRAEGRNHERRGVSRAWIFLSLASINHKQQVLTTVGAVGKMLTVRTEDELSYQLVRAPLLAIHDGRYPRGCARLPEKTNPPTIGAEYWVNAASVLAAVQNNDPVIWTPEGLICPACAIGAEDDFISYSKVGRADSPVDDCPLGANHTSVLH